MAAAAVAGTAPADRLDLCGGGAPRASLRRAPAARVPGRQCRQSFGGRLGQDAGRRMDRGAAARARPSRGDREPRLWTPRPRARDGRLGRAFRARRSSRGGRRSAAARAARARRARARRARSRRRRAARDRGLRRRRAGARRRLPAPPPRARRRDRRLRRGGSRQRPRAAARAAARADRRAARRRRRAGRRRPVARSGRGADPRCRARRELVLRASQAGVAAPARRRSGDAAGCAARRRVGTGRGRSRVRPRSAARSRRSVPKSSPNAFSRIITATARAISPTSRTPRSGSPPRRTPPRSCRAGSPARSCAYSRSSSRWTHPAAFVDWMERTLRARRRLAQ